MKKSYIQQVSAFHKTFNHPIEPTPVIPAKQRCELRVNLIREELEELEEAIKDNDLVEIADALCDLQYVLSGAILEFGLGDIFDTLFEEVQRSNMSKTCKTIEEAEATLEHYSAKGQEGYIKQVGELFLVFRKGDDKTLKSVQYSPADLKKILQADATK